MIRDLWFVTRGSCIVTRDGKELGEIPKWKSWTCKRMSFDTPLGEWENRTGGTPPVFSVRIGEATEKKGDGRKGVRKIREKVSGSWRVASASQGRSG